MTRRANPTAPTSALAAASNHPVPRTRGGAPQPASPPLPGQIGHAAFMESFHGVSVVGIPFAELSLDQQRHWAAAAEAERAAERVHIGELSEWRRDFGAGVRVAVERWRRERADSEECMLWIAALIDEGDERFGRVSPLPSLPEEKP